LREGAATAIAGGVELTGAGGSGAPVRGFPLREHWEREEVMTSSLRGKTRSGKAISAVDHDGTMAGPPEHMGKTLGTTFSHGRKLERERGRRHAHHSENRRRSRLGSLD